MMSSFLFILKNTVDGKRYKTWCRRNNRDIPNREESLRNLDSSNCLQASVKPGDILVGKVTPCGETSSSPEENEHDLFLVKRLQMSEIHL